LHHKGVIVSYELGVLGLGARSCNLYMIFFPFMVLLELLEEALRAGGHAR
jgi:hypothetical protein